MVELPAGVYFFSAQPPGRLFVLCFSCFCDFGSRWTFFLGQAASSALYCFFALLAALIELLFFRSLAAATCFHWPSPQLISFGGRALGWRFPSAPPPARLFLLLVWGVLSELFFFGSCVEGRKSVLTWSSGRWLKLPWCISRCPSAFFLERIPEGSKQAIANPFAPGPVRFRGKRAQPRHENTGMLLRIHSTRIRVAC